ncbi:hypothetical protein IEQ34_022267 [Dendrobium chrysotoxum]|uniref:Uncharacterized protein n=1 Tax=Dendrobium chrysotoxum TaxID=161865 RepID=A0AAV7FX43_DENCH|nr:hypothetical protein IEQ34_022267 [Dendrobium chrysotoxum]
MYPAVPIPDATPLAISFPPVPLPPSGCQASRGFISARSTSGCPASRHFISGYSLCCNALSAATRPSPERFTSASRTNGSRRFISGTREVRGGFVHKNKAASFKIHAFATHFLYTLNAIVLVK